MANVQIPNLTAAIALNGTEQLEAVQAGSSVRITTAQIKALGTTSSLPWDVSVGGTGAATFLAGYLKADGVTPFTTSATIPSTDITGLGTMSVQNADNVAITGGSISNAVVSGSSINSSTIGISTPAAGNFTTIGATTQGTADFTSIGSAVQGTGNFTSIGVLAPGTGNFTTIGATTQGSGAFTTVSANASRTASNNIGAFNYGTLGYSDTGVLASFSASIAGYDQITVQNTNSAANASANLNISNNAATASTNFGELGINSSAFTGSGAFSGAGNVYLAAASTDLAIGTYGSNAIHFVVNSGATDAATISSAGILSLANALAVSSGGTGATTPNAALTNLTTYAATATAAGTTALTNASAYFQYFTGVTTQTIVLPATGTLATGWSFHIVNNSTGTLTVNASDSSFLITVIPSTTVMATCISTSVTSQAGWEAGYTDFSTATGSGSVVLATSPTLITPTLGAAVGTSLALNGATLGSNNFSVTGKSFLNGTVGVGGGAGLNVGISNSITNITGFADITAYSATGFFSSTSTGTSASFRSSAGLSNSNFTATNLVHFYATPVSPTVGNTPVITNQYGFLSDSTVGTAGAVTITNAYGVASAIAAATNRWNFFASGTANNAFAGNVAIGSTTAPTIALEVTGAASISTSVTTPLINGGIDIGSKLTLQSTSAAGTGDAILFYTQSQLERMNIDTTGTITSFLPAPTTKAAAATLTFSEIRTKIIIYTGAAATVSFPTGANLDSVVASGQAINSAYDVCFINTSANLLTIGANGNTTLGSLAVPTLTSASFRIRKVAASTYIIYRIN